MTAPQTPQPSASVRLWEQMLLLMTDYGVRVLGAILFLTIAWIIGAYIRRSVRMALERAKVEATLAKFLSNLSRWVLVVISLVACLGIFGVQTASFAAVIGSAGLAIGLALQGSLSHLAAGILLMLTRPFKAGDMVTVAGQTGKVDEIELFATHLDTMDNRRVVIPNAQVFNGVIENITHHPVRRIDLDVGVDYAADVDATRRILMEAGERVEGRAADRPVDVFLRQFGPSSVDWQVRVWAKREDFGVVRQRVIREVKGALERERIAIPFPQVTLSRR
jgi:small conductance mechanosensitive channel